jgi:hypothetical protein
MVRRSFLAAFLLVLAGAAGSAADKPGAPSPDALWDDLASADGAKAYRAVAALGADPARAVALLTERLRPEKAPDRARIPRLIADLDSDSFDTREKATAELENFGELAAPALKKALLGKPSAELQRRAEELLEGLAARPLLPERRRQLRGVEVLEGLGTPQARKALAKLADGPAGAWLTQEARRALGWLDRRAAAPTGVAIKPDERLRGAGFTHEYGAAALALSADGKVLFSGNPAEPIRAWDFATGRELRRYEGQESRVMRGWYTLALSPDGKTIAAGSHKDFRVHLWDVASGKERTLTGGEDAYEPVAMSPDGRHLAAGSYKGGDIVLFDLDVGREVRRLPGGGTRFPCVAFSRDGRTMAAGSANGAVVLWETATGQERARFARFTQRDVRSLTFSPDDKLVVVADDGGTIHLLDRFSGAERTAIPAGALSFAISPDGKHIAAAVLHREVHLYDTATGKEERSLPARAEVVAFTPDGKTLLTGAMGGWAGTRVVRLWDVATGKEQTRREGR